MEFLEPPYRRGIGILEGLPVLLAVFLRKVPDRLAAHGPVPVKALQGGFER